MKSRDFELDTCLDKIDEAVCKDRELLPESVSPPGIKTLSEWFRCLTELQHVEGKFAEFCQNAATAVKASGGLDGAVLILNAAGNRIDDVAACEMQTHGSQETKEVPSICFSLLAKVLDENATIYHSSQKLNSADGVEAPATVAISPIRNKSSEIIGFLAGWREQSEANKRFGIRELEAHFVRLVAKTVSATLVRYKNETRIADQNALLSQAFPPKVIEQLMVDPLLFEGRELVVSVLFADLRGFSAISNRLPARQTYAMINEIMDLWTEFVMDLSGAVVDYFGDGLVAFWNAPLQVDNHASMAIKCAQKIQQSLPGLTETWSPILGCPIDAGVGISTGLAHVGNCGSRQRVKYGPHGSVVNLAARLEKLTKEIGIPIVISGETASQSKDEFFSRRVCKSDVRGFEKAVDVYQPIFSEMQYGLAYLQEFEDVLNAVESNLSEQVADRVSKLCQAHPHDPAARRLLERVRQTLPQQEAIFKRDESEIW